MGKPPTTLRSSISCFSSDCRSFAKRKDTETNYYRGHHDGLANMFIALICDRMVASKCECECSCLMCGCGFRMVRTKFLESNGKCWAVAYKLLIPICTSPTSICLVEAKFCCCFEYRNTLLNRSSSSSSMWSSSFIASKFAHITVALAFILSGADGFILIIYPIGWPGHYSICVFLSPTPRPPCWKHSYSVWSITRRYSAPSAIRKLDSMDFVMMCNVIMCVPLRRCHLPSSREQRGTQPQYVAPSPDMRGTFRCAPTSGWRPKFESWLLMIVHRTFVCSLVCAQWQWCVKVITSLISTTKIDGPTQPLPKREGISWLMEFIGNETEVVCDRCTRCHLFFVMKDCFLLFNFRQTFLLIIYLF